MRKLAYLLLTLAVVTCGNKAAGAADTDLAGKNANTIEGTNDDYVAKRSEYSFRTEVQTIEDEGEVLWDTIVVYMTDARGHTQKLYGQAQPLDTVNWEKGSIGEIEEKDWNFDGIPDLQVCTGPTNGFGNYTYDVWLWDDKAHQFEELKFDSVIFDPEIDTENKCIISNWRLDDDMEFVRYEWKDGKLVETNREQKSYKEMMEEE